MQQRYQYSSLFTAGLLMQPRPVHASLIPIQHPEISSTPFPTGNGPRKPVEPLMISIPLQAPSPRRTSRRRRSSVTLHLSPVSGVRLSTRAVEDAWERSKRNASASSRGGYPATSLKDQPLVASVDENEDIEANLPRKSLSRSRPPSLPMQARTSRRSLGVYSASVHPLSANLWLRKQSATLLQPKPVPTMPLPALPIDGSQPRIEIEATQASL
ncbi:SubName: Full=Uncharacterized protein {ECO:0000313/EMBL:CCA70748.1} [Serendipita indica DSM 11827]|nr:SubName: Full=Uncharacterized protein {ECO:0000313/EMBL:CCA70748.1} [Serendipita indica DSM 11827]